MQILHCAMKSTQVGRARSSAGNRTAGHREQTPVFKDLKEITDAFDQIFAAMYPPKVVDPDVEDEPEVTVNTNIVKVTTSSFHFFLDILTSMEDGEK